MPEIQSQQPPARPLCTHLLLVHDQLIANILPALDEHFRPGRVCLLCAPHFQSQADRLTIILKESGVDVEHWLLDDPWDLDHIRQRVSEFVTDPARGEIALNVSSGTIPMSLAAFEIFRAAGQPIYYVHPERDYVVWLTPRDTPSFDLADRIRLGAFLQARDLRLVSVKRQGITAPLSELTATLVRRVERHSDALSILNGYAAEAVKVKQFTSSPLKNEQLHIPEVLELLSLYGKQGLLRVDPRQRLVFANEEARFYVNGGWLEEHVFGVIGNLRRELPMIQDLARNLKVEWDEQGSPVENELDVAFLADNRLYLIECKTKKFGKDASAESDVAGTLYKLNTLRESLGGSGGRAMLVSYRPLEKPARQRAQELGIEVCEGMRIGELAGMVRRWVGG